MPYQGGPPSRRQVVGAAGAATVALATTSIPAAAQAGHPRTVKPTVVLVHGAWADAASWQEVTRRLQRRGYTVHAAPNPLRGLAEDAEALNNFLAQRVTGPVVLVGHSYGGAVVTNAVTPAADVRALVYVDAFVPEQGETVLGLQGEGADPGALFDQVVHERHGEQTVDLYIKPALFGEVFAGDLAPATADLLAASQRPIALSALLEASGPPAWKNLPSWYVLGTRDHILPPDRQRSMARRARSRIIEVAGSHLVMLSRPDAVVDVIVSAARGTA
ncbi:alpha/beta fold hydrolase [Streptomyces sp. NPDC057621]|uniref:alpha/beta fold hydrolase n=1 Tax=Streptomyces sp. NPDC057621 TaxID=3346186 RepID=UPI0036AD61E6